MEMKRYLRGCLLLCLLFTISLMTAYNSKNTEEPRMKILAGGQEIQVIYYGDRYNKSIEEIEKNLVKFMKNGDLEALPYIDLTEIITIVAENFETKKYTISDYILTTTGTFRYNTKSVLTSVVPVNYRKSTMVLTRNPSASLSSNSYDYMAGKSIRCFVIRTDIDGSPFTFAFILRTDAN